ncbi:HEAT repeat domain-containing protein [Granulicella sp. L60]|uniref:HEAT repeat domain-containing protein n=1 Tax=Granulicella sp. L60 TaxID=1641866 RepID=UPI00131A6FAC|nr:HEAT repeat domain-containing protein [Granulicella sp. L60]
MTPSIRTTLSSAVLLLSAAIPSLHALTPELSSIDLIAEVQDDGAYTAGSKALEDHRWPDAVASFDKVINAKGKRIDSALYWKAYSLNKLGKSRLASATCDQLRAQDASSSWNRDCSALTVTVHVDTQALAENLKNINAQANEVTDSFNALADSPDSHPARGSDEDLKMLALNSLLNQDPARAIPLLRGVLTGNQSTAMKKHALFVLAQSRSPEAESILHDAVTGKMDPQLQREAIQSMAVFQGKRANETLVEVYKTTSDPQIKRSVISALFITQDAPRMVELARTEKDLETKRRIVSELALMNDKAATDYMMELLK